MNRVFLMLIAAVAMVVFSVDVADACNRCGSCCCSAPSAQCCPPSRCCQPQRRCCEPQRRCWVPQRRGCCCPTTCCCDAGYGVSYGGSAVMMEGAAFADPCCTGGQVMDTGTGTAPTVVGDVMYEGEGAVIEGPVVEEGTVDGMTVIEDAPAADAVISSEAPPVEAPAVPEAPESEEESAGDEG